MLRQRVGGLGRIKEERKDQHQKRDQQENWWGQGYCEAAHERVALLRLAGFFAAGARAGPSSGGVLLLVEGCRHSVSFSFVQCEDSVCLCEAVRVLEAYVGSRASQLVTMRQQQSTRIAQRSSHKPSRTNNC